MDNTETLATLVTGHRSKSNKIKNITYETKTMGNTDSPTKTHVQYDLNYGIICICLK